MKNPLEEYSIIFIGNPVLVQYGEAAHPFSEAPHDWLQTKNSAWKRKVSYIYPLTLTIASNLIHQGLR
jgi:hypothetical protein